MQPLVTIVICTKNRPHFLSDCLFSINMLDYPKKEVIVVDGSTQAFAKKVKEITEAYGSRYIYESKPGLSAARNTAIVKSKGDFIAFTDDDCIVDREWLPSLLRNFSRATVMCVTGRTLPFKEAKDNVPSAYENEKFLDRDRGHDKRFFSITSTPLRISQLLSVATTTVALKEEGPIPWCIGTGNNMLFRKQIFRLIGLFDENLGVGTPQGSGEDLDMFFRIFWAGYELIYDPNSIVRHKEKRDLREIASISYNYGRGTGCLCKKYICNLYFCTLYFGRFLNLTYGILKALFERDTCSGYTRFKNLQAMISTIGYRPRRMRVESNGPS